MAKNVEKYQVAVAGFREFLDDLEGLIDRSGLKLNYLSDKIGMSSATFYRKRKKKSFSVNEAEKILEICTKSKSA